jgi:hypothetical protein
MCQNIDFRFLHFIAFCQVFFPALFRFSDLVFYYLFFFFGLVFYHPLFFPSFSLLAHVVSFLAYPNLLENKILGCYCCCGGGFTEACEIWFKM